jgi:hypothetical protein
MIRHPARRLTCLAALLLTVMPAPASAQPQPSDDARRFLVYPPNKVISFQENDGFFYLHYDGPHLDKGRDSKGDSLFYNQVIQVTRYLDEDQSVAGCKAMLAVPTKGKTIRMIEGFPCAFVEESTDGIGTTYYRKSWYARGRYFVGLGEGATPRSMLPAAAPVGPLLAALDNVQPAAPKPDLQISVAPPGSGTGPASVRIDGNTIYVTDDAGNQRKLTLLTAKKAEMPSFTPPTVSGEAKAVERYVVTRVFEASYGNLPADQRAAFVAGMPMPSDVVGAAAGAAARATLSAGESAVNWVKNNPADASLLGLSVAVSLAFPISAFANPAVATGGAAVLRGVVGGAMVAGTTGFVSSLTGTFISDKSALQRVKEAAAQGVGDATSSVPGSLAGAGFEAAVGQGLAKAAVTVGSVAVGVAVDKAVEKAQVSQTLADAALKAPSFVGSLVTPSGKSYEPGGISFNFDR